jgi:hypothetical protein
MGNVLIMTNNFLDPTVVSNTTVSSEQTAFPASNVYNAQRRSKVWRSNGYWEITSANKTLIFRETTSVNLTATLTEGSYASDALLFAEIKSKMQSAGSSTYTLSRDTTTSKVKFASNGIGGGGIFEIIWTSSTGMASLLGFDSTESDTGSLTYIADELNIGSGEWFKWDMGISTNPKAFILIGKRNEAIQITPSAIIKIQGNETDYWTSPTFEQTLVYDDSAISSISTNGLHTQELRYWRLLITDINNANGYCEIGCLFLGDYIDMTRGAVQFPFNGKYVDRSITVFSEGGQSFSDIREKTEEFSIEWFGLTIAEKEQIDTHFNEYGTAVPFFISFDNEEIFSTNSNYYIRYVKFSDEPSYKLVSPGVYGCSMALREEL